MSDFLHPSRPGNFRIDFSEGLRESLAALAEAMIPGNDVYPSAAHAHVPQFIEERSSPADLKMLENLVGDDLLNVDSARAALEKVETENPELFAWLRAFVYHGYYSSPRVLAAMKDTGYGYHGAPQPLGYQISDDLLLPTKGRGSFIPTDEVSRATL